MILQDRFRDRVQEALQLKGWKQSQLASALGWTPQRVSDVIRGQREPGFKTVEAFATALELDPSLLVSGRPVEMEDLAAVA